MAIMRMKVATANGIDALSRFLMDKALPLIRALLPALVELGAPPPSAADGAGCEPV